MSGAGVYQRKVSADFTPLPEDAGGAVGRALQGIGDEMANFGSALDNAEQQRVLIGGRNDLQKGIDDLKDQFRSDPDPATMPERFTKAASDIAKQAGANLHGHAALQFQEESGVAIESARVGIKDMAFSRTAGQANASLDDSIETSSRSAAFASNEVERGNIVAGVGKSVNGLVDTGMLTPEAAQKKLQTFRERLALFDGKREVFLDPKKALDQLGKADYLPGLDPLSRVELQNSADSEIRVREREARARLAQGRLEASQAAGDLHDVIASGLPVSQDVIDHAKTTAIASGDPRALHRYAGLLHAKEFADGLRGASQRDVEAAQAELEAQANKSGANEAMATALTATRKFSETMNSALSHDPLMWAADQGVANVAPLQLNGTDAPAAFAARIKTAQAVTARYGVPFQPLTAAESQTLKTRLDTSQGPDQRLAVLQQVVHGFGSYASPVLAKLGAQDPAIARAGALVASGAAHYGSARDVLTGMDLLKATPTLRPTPSGRALGGQANLSSAYAMMPDELGGVVQSADAIYAARAPRQGLTGADVANSREGRALYQRAFQEAAGARYEADGTQWGGLATYRGNSVVVPGSVKADGFEDLIHHLSVDDLSKASIGGAPPTWEGGATPENLIKRSWLISGPNGSYGLSATDPSRGSIKPVLDKNGKPFRFNWGTAQSVMAARLKGGP